jgi:hypothetical protein
MPTPVEVSQVVRRQGSSREALERIGGMWRDRPWSLSERNAILEIELGDTAQWEFFVMVGGLAAPITVMRSADSRKYLAVRGIPCALLGLPDVPSERALGREV